MEKKNDVLIVNLNEKVVSGGGGILKKLREGGLTNQELGRKLTKEER
jgi:hypothetical protein